VLCADLERGLVVDLLVSPEIYKELLRVGYHASVCR